MTRVERVIDAVIQGAGWLAKASALLIVLVVTGNVLMRYGFSIGSTAMQELQWHLVPPIALLGLSYSLHHGEHVRVDVFYEHMPERVQQAVELLTSVLTVLIAVYLGYLSLGFVEHSWAMGERSSNPSGLPMRYVLKAFIPVGFGLLALQGIAAGMRSARAVLPAARRTTASASVAEA